MLLRTMLANLGGSAVLSGPSVLPFFLQPSISTCRVCIRTAIIGAPKLNNQRVLSTPCAARRRVRYDDEEEDVDGDEEYGHKEEIAMLELYSQSAMGEALIVHAMVDEEEVEVLIFKGFSSCLSGRTPPDPSRSVLPARAVIKSIDIIKGPFDPSNTEYIRKGLTWEAFKTSLLAT
ncbi:uncharacterized protein LOC122312918 [Carya illinoinensis]|uniref:DUF7734 domain-containing protein n=2 Tax=Carya illinoinensis TaxID=32201 RepID=A0A922ETP6_CARIL|nr:uncharacterized protein LOC122312918 [Carya illinoinensis]KAG6707835.1 hypothetical protein I3842_06G052200 [Carya illinoinensis]